MTEHDELTAVWPVAIDAIEPPGGRGDELYRAARERGEQRSQPTFIGSGNAAVDTNDGHLPLGQARVVALADLADAEARLAFARHNDAEAAEAVKVALAERKVTQAHEALAIERLRKAQATVAYTCGIEP